LESGGNLIGSGGISLLCLSGEESTLFYRHREVAEQAMWGVDMKGRGGESNRQPLKLNNLRLQGPLSKTLPIRVVIQNKPHRIPTFLATLPHYKGCNILSS
jgi:hypothetical protein